MTANQKKIKLHELKYERNHLIVKQCGILEAMNNIPYDIYDPESPQIKSMKEFLKKLVEKEYALDMLIIKTEAEPVELGEE